ncbi:MAG: glycosyltransferase [Gammaproteobacteria bacterium]|jgi:glycosyltransferase involved in cell wall biosynthesis|nr:glycosyltransferase [Gammaproteobacteria bacterium]
MSIDYSVIIPAFNEEAFLPQTLNYLQESMSRIDEQGEVIVVDNNSSDRTADIAREYGTQLVFEAVNQISRARNAGAKIAQGEYLIFLDADTLLDQSLIRFALDLLEQGECCGGGARVELDGELQGLPKFSLNFWNWISRNMYLAAGCFIFCRKEGFEVTGGFSEKVYASEEIWFSLSLRSWGKKNNLSFIIIDEPGVISSKRKLDWYSEKQLVLLTVSLILFPPLIFFRKFCPHWYRRQSNVTKEV